MQKWFVGDMKSAMRAVEREIKRGVFGLLCGGVESFVTYFQGMSVGTS